MAGNELEAKASEAAELLKLLGHPFRLMIVCFLEDEKKTVTEIEQFLQTSQSNVSQHLGKLRTFGILKAEKKANQVFYSIQQPGVIKIIKILKSVYCS